MQGPHFRLGGFTRCVSLLVVSAALTLVGCGGGSDLVSVTGKVMNGKDALTTGSVTFHPDAEKGNESTTEPTGQIDKSGNYTLFTNETEGAAAGWYKVTVFAEEARPTEGEGAYAPPKYLVRKEYTTVESTPISIEVKEGAPAGHYDIKLKAKK